MNRRYLLLFSPSLLMFLFAGYNFAKKYHRRESLVTLVTYTAETPAPSSGRRGPASVGETVPLKSLISEGLSAREDLRAINDEIAGIGTRLAADVSPCRSRLDCLSPDGSEKDLETPLADSIYSSEKEYIVAACEKGSIDDCQQVARLEAQENNFEAARDYAEYACSKGNLTACKDLTNF